MDRSVAVALLVFCSLLAVSPLLAAAENPYTISVENGEIDVPDQTVTVEGQEFTISAIGLVEPGEDIEVIVTGPDGEYQLQVYEDSLTIWHTDSLTGDDATSFETEHMDPGTYSLVINEDGVDEAIQPFVVAAYDTSLSVPSDVPEGETFTAEITTAEYSSVTAPPIDAVEVVVASDSMTERIEASETGDGEYVTDIDADYDPGEYRLYVTVYENADSDDGEYNVISMSDERTITISDADDESDGEEPNDSGGPAADGSNGNTGGIEDGDQTDASEDDEGDDTQGENVTDDTETNETSAEASGDEGTIEDGVEDAGGEDAEPNGTADGEGEGMETDGDTPGNEQNESTEDGGDVVTPQGMDGSDETADEAPLDGIRLLVLTMLALAVALRVR